MKTTITEKDGLLVVALSGGFDTVASNQAERDLAPVFERDDCDVEIDCSDTLYISSSGLRLLLEILKNSKAHGHHVYMKDISNTIREAFTLTGFIGLFEYL